ncbi:hypothetical protein ACSBR1_032779 [Camellia fascicularis]
MHTLLPLPLVAKILKIQPPRTTNVEDNPRWVKSPDGEFSTSSAYELIIDHQSQEGDWSWIWKLKVPQKLKSFVWLVLHEKILTNHMRKLRDLTNDLSCPYCDSVEDIEHLLRFCPKAVQVWCTVFSKDWYSNILHLSWKDWFTRNTKKKNKLHYLFLVTTWTIWKNRNKWVFEHKNTPIFESVNSITNFAKAIVQAFNLDITTSLKFKSLTVWSYPSAGKIKLNTDGSTRRNGGGGGFGGLFRDERGSWISGYYGRLEICTSLEAELWAVYKGLTIILQRGFNQVIIETDAKQVVHLLSEELDERCPFRGIVEDARIILRGCDCSIQHIKRDANICVDAMAKFGENQPAELLIVFEPPQEIRSMLIADIVHLSEEGART